MADVLLVSNDQSYLNISIREKLNELKYQVTMSKGDPDEVSKIKEDICAIVLFVNEEMIHNQSILIYLKDKSIENDIPIFLLGDTNHVEEAKKVLPKKLIVSVFERPIDISEVVKAVDYHIKKFGNNLKKKNPQFLILSFFLREFLEKLNTELPCDITVNSSAFTPKD